MKKKKKKRTNQIGMVPLNPADVLAIRRNPWRRVEICARDQDVLRLVLEGDCHNRIHNLLLIGVVFTDRHQDGPVIIQPGVSISPLPVLWGDQLRGGIGAGDTVERLVSKVAVEHLRVVDQRGPPTILMDPGPGLAKKEGGFST